MFQIFKFTKKEKGFSQAWQNSFSMIILNENAIITRTANALQTRARLQHFNKVTRFFVISFTCDFITNEQGNKLRCHVEHYKVSQGKSNCPFFPPPVSALPAPLCFGS